jgi:hypothetical protein
MTRGRSICHYYRTVRYPCANPFPWIISDRYTVWKVRTYLIRCYRPDRSGD